MAIVSPASAPPRTREARTLEDWALRLILADNLGEKLRAPEGHLEESDAGVDPAAARRPVPDSPGRPPQLRITPRSPRTPKDLHDSSSRARLLHTFAHHELQAAELFARALLAFPETPPAFRRGLARLAGEELQHLRLYLKRLAELGAAYGDWPVRDWFWERVPLCADAVSFTAFMGLGLEGANLEHGPRFARLLRAAGDEVSAALLERIEQDEVGHVAFARTWFEQFTHTPLDFETWARHLPAPLTPAVLRSQPLNREARERAGMPASFLDALDQIGDTTRPSERR